MQSRLPSYLKEAPALALHRLPQRSARLAAESFTNAQHCLCPLQHLHVSRGTNSRHLALLLVCKIGRSAVRGRLCLPAT